MDLTPNEKKMVAYLRLRKDGWPKIRWFCAIVYPLFGVLIALLLRGLWLGGGEQIVIVVAPIYIAGFSALASWFYGQWNGQPHIDLLLRVIDETVSKQPPSEVTQSVDDF